MPRTLTALLSLVIAVGITACAGSGASPAPTHSAAAPSATAAAPSALPQLAPTIGLLEWKVVVASTIKSGPTEFAITNLGAIPHELLVFKSDLDPAAYPTNAAGDIDEEGAGVTLVSDGENIDPAGTQARSVDLTPGKYVFVCNIPGHFKEGMFTVVTVTP